MPHRIIDPDMFPNIYLGYIDPDDHYSYSGVMVTTTGDNPLRRSTPQYRMYKSLDELIAHVEERRDSLKYPPISNLRDKIQEYIFRLNIAPESYFHHVKLQPSITQDILTGAKLAKSLSRAAISGVITPGSDGWATKTEATKRASICVQCPNNELPSAGEAFVAAMFRKGRKKIAKVFTPLRSTPYDDQLGNCGVCTCPLDSKVHYADEVIRDVNQVPVEDFPEDFIGKDKKTHSCWVYQILKE